MASPVTPSTGRALSITPGARVSQTPLSDETIWKRLKEVGFDEESIKGRDKAALIAYIAKLEAEIFDLQHHMGLLLLERRELASKYEQITTSAEAAELNHKQDQATHLSALAEAKKREEGLKKAIGVEKECIASIEKALHEMRAESAETKVSAESKLAEAYKMMEDAQQKLIDAEAKMRAGEALQAEASRHHRAAERMLQEVEAREADLSRHTVVFKSDCDAKEKEINLQRQSLSERRKALQQEHERLLDGQTLLNQREEYVANKSQEIILMEKELEASKASIEEEIRALNDEKSNLKLTMASLAQREEAVIEREALLNKKEQELLVSQEKLASKGSAEIQKVISSQETVLRARRSEFEAELQMKRKLVEDEIDAKRRAWELREVDLRQHEDIVLEKEHDLEAQSKALADKEKDLTEKMDLLNDKERILNAAGKDIELKRALLQQEKEEITNMNLDFQKSLNSLEDKKRQVDCAKEKLETMKSETNELTILEIKLKEEVDIVRAQKLELMTEEERLKTEKAKFEAEWDLIEEKREELLKEAERIAGEREAVSRLLKDEHDSIRLEKAAIRDQHKHDVELLNREREEFMNKMVHERSEWFSKIQQEHTDFLLGIEMRKRELECSIEKRREEVESYLRDKEQAFELERKNELQLISSLKEEAERELEHVAVEMKKLEAERMEINLDRERRDREWAMMIKSIEELKVQTQKLEKQRELLCAEREEISAQIEHLKKLEDLKLALDNMEVAEMRQSNIESSQRRISAARYLKQRRASLQDTDLINVTNKGDILNSPIQKPNATSPPNSARFSWIKRCTEMVFKNTPQKTPTMTGEKSITSDHLDRGLKTVGNLDSSNGYHGQKFKSKEIFGKTQTRRYTYCEPKVILEVPSEGEIVKEMHDVESTIKEDNCEEITRTISEQVHQTGRKRRVDSYILEDFIDPLPEEMQNNKKRRQQEHTGADASNHSTTSIQETFLENDHGSKRNAEDSDVLTIEKMVKISEQTCEVIKIDNFSNQELEHQQTSELTSDQNNVQDGETNGHANSRPLGTDVLPCSDELQDASGKCDLRVDDLHDGEKVTENIARRTRSKQKP